MQRIAVVGAGKMGWRHAGAYAQIPNAELVAICDTRADGAERLANEYSVPAFMDINTLFSELDVDIVDVCTPASAHLDPLKSAASAKKHVICEKPLARTAGQAMEAAKTCEEAGVKLFVAHVLRWFPEYRKLHDLVKSGAVGDAVEVRTSRCSTLPNGIGNWYANMQMSGGAVMDLIIHDFDWLRWCFGSVKRVYARGLFNSGIPTDYALVTLKFDNGTIAHVEGSWARPNGFVASVEIAGNEGLLSFCSSDATALFIEKKSQEGETQETIVPESPALHNPYVLELSHFVNCVETGQTPEITPEDAIDAIRIGEAALRSITTGEPVTLA